MLNLKLFNALHGDGIATLVLQQAAPGFLRYYIASSSVNYSVVVSGRCEGELANGDIQSFDIALSTIAPLDDKHNFRLSYKDGNLQFIEAEDRFTVTPLYVEHYTDASIDIIAQYTRYANAQYKWEDAKSKIDDLTKQLANTRANHESVKRLALSGVPSDDPFTVPEVDPVDELDAKYAKRETDLERELRELQKNAHAVVSLDYSRLNKLATVAARNSTTVSLCDSYAVVDLKTVFLLQKVDCGVRSVQGKLLSKLLSEKRGNFYSFEDNVIFHSVNGTDNNRTDIVLTLNNYMPDARVDSTVITRGATLEKYVVDFKNILPVVSSVINKFDDLTLDMGTSELLLSNDRGEVFRSKFLVKEVKTKELNKALRGEHVSEIVLSSVQFPKIVQRMLYLLQNEVTIYVKERKVILQSGEIYIVWGR